MGKSLLLIGGTGFFGKSILDAFKRGLLKDFNISKIIVFSRNINQFKTDYPELCFKGVAFLNGDITSIKKLPFAEFVIHAATSTNMTDYSGNNIELAKNNIELSVSNYCRLAPEIHFNSKILYCSSGAVYGKQPIEIEKISECHNFNSDFKRFSSEKRIYCLGKRFAESEIVKLGLLGLTVSIARCFAFSGKYLPKNQHFAYGNFVGQAEKGQDIQINSKDIIYRSYMEADDLVKSLMSILTVSSNNCPIYNVGSDKPEPLHLVAEKIADRYGVNVIHKINHKSKIGDRYVPNTDKLKKLMNI